MLTLEHPTAAVRRIVRSFSIYICIQKCIHICIYIYRCCLNKVYQRVVGWPLKSTNNSNRWNKGEVNLLLCAHLRRKLGNVRRGRGLGWQVPGVEEHKLTNARLPRSRSQVLDSNDKKCRKRPLHPRKIGTSATRGPSGRAWLSNCRCVSRVAECWIDPNTILKSWNPKESMYCPFKDSGSKNYTYGVWNQSPQMGSLYGHLGNKNDKASASAPTASADFQKPL